MPCSWEASFLRLSKSLATPKKITRKQCVAGRSRRSAIVSELAKNIPRYRKLNHLPSSWDIGDASLGPCSSPSAAVTNRYIARPRSEKQERTMLTKSKSIAAIAAVVTTIAAASLTAAPAQAAAVYCKTAGVPQGCVVRPIAPAPVVAPAVRVAAVGVARVGY